MIRASITLAAFAALAACATPAATPECTQGPVRLLQNAPGEPGSPCTRLSETEFVLDIRPEAEPINPSPWYAFTLEAAQAGEITVTLDYAAARHRYAPWLSAGDGAWSPLPASQLALSDDGRIAQLTLPLAPGQSRIAAQPPYQMDAYDALETRWSGDWRSIGQSVEGRPIRARVSAPAEPDDGWIVILGRQHPPEIPGAWALESFADVLVEARAAGTLGSGLIIIPLLNPDGLAAGHWRFNAGLVDLNRGWADPREPEVRAVFDLLSELAVAPGDITLMVDFHATIADRLYLPQPDELPAAANARLEAWLAAMEANGLPGLIEPRRTNPARRVSAKAAFTDGWGAVAVTWEAGDASSEATVREIARRGAETWLASAQAHRVRQD